MTLRIGPVALANAVLVAPMSGVSDLPFRRAASRFGAGAVVSEMVACEELARARPDMVRRAAGDAAARPFIMQLAGREPRWMAAGARLAEKAGADVVDINMGCPARQVTGVLSGSALMRDLDHAASLITATVQATALPVTLKMRLGWDRDSLNAPELAARAEEAGVALVTVHARTRNQFYKGRADWGAVRATRRATSLPLIVNGDVVDARTAREALSASGADGVMIGRAAVGRPWLPGAVARALQAGGPERAPSEADQKRALVEHYQETLAHYGTTLGVRVARKHLAAAIDAAPAGVGPADRRRVRASVCRLNDPLAVLSAIEAFFAERRPDPIAA
ncbi:MAG: tRNA dihydrouridine synthase DusB [Pseudomonadota bacterium]